jgi:hypothetical protein
MAAPTTLTEHPDAPRAGRARPSIRQWTGQVLLCGAFYFVYEWARSLVRGDAGPALVHARQVIRAERALHIFVEHGIQQAALHSHKLVEAADIYYGTIHFVVPAIVLIVLFRSFPDRYREWRNILALLGVLALFGFAFYPLTPPRYLPPHWHFVDTGVVIGGMGPFDSGGMKDTGNLYAAMPSLHIGWSTWCVCALYPVLRRRWVKVALVAYPIVTLAVTVVTANHYILDGVGGVAWLAAAWAIMRMVKRRPGTQKPRIA